MSDGHSSEARGNSHPKHGHAWRNGERRETKTYVSWTCMNNRCRNPNFKMYSYYGGRGISVCERWRGGDGFVNFLADMGEAPPGMTLDRINTDGNYEPGNCRWVSQKDQMNNRRNNIVVTIDGRTQTLMQWCEELGLKFNTILYRLRRGWTAGKALTEPIGDWRGHNK